MKFFNNYFELYLFLEKERGTITSAEKEQYIVSTNNGRNYLCIIRGDESNEE